MDERAKELQRQQRPLEIYGQIFKLQLLGIKLQAKFTLAHTQTYSWHTHKHITHICTSRHAGQFMSRA